MSDFTFSVVTAIFTVGGLIGSLVANIIMDRWGRKGAIRISAAFLAAGAGLMGISGSVGMLGLGRYACLATSQSTTRNALDFLWALAQVLVCVSAQYFSQR
jgi:MFS family permease